MIDSEFHPSKESKVDLLGVKGSQEEKGLVDCRSSGVGGFLKVQRLWRGCSGQVAGVGCDPGSEALRSGGGQMIEGGKEKNGNTSVLEVLNKPKIKTEVVVERVTTRQKWGWGDRQNGGRPGRGWVAVVWWCSGDLRFKAGAVGGNTGSGGLLVCIRQQC